MLLIVFVGILAGALTVVAFLVADPYALLDIHAFHQGLTTQTETASSEGGKLGLAPQRRIANLVDESCRAQGRLRLATASLADFGGCTPRRRLASTAFFIPKPDRPVQAVAPVTKRLYLTLTSRIRW